MLELARMVQVLACKAKYIMNLNNTPQCKTNQTNSIKSDVTVFFLQIAICAVDLHVVLMAAKALIVHELRIAYKFQRHCKRGMHCLNYSINIVIILYYIIAAR